jgi:hypothetical protein
MQDYQERVLDEKKELDEKIEKLMSFLELENFGIFSEEELSRLWLQSHIMKAYSACLGERIAHF